MLKKVLSILIAALLLFSALPLTAFAADADVADTGDNVIRDVALTINDPVAGYSPSSYTAYAHGENYKIAEKYEGTSPVWWWCTKDGSSHIMKDGEVFEDGAEYEVTIAVEANSGYVFDDKCRAYLNGKTAWATVSEYGSLLVRFVFGRETQMFDRLDIEVTEPKVGDLPDTMSSVYDMDRKLAWTTKWYCVTDGNTEMAPSRQFEYGKQYEVTTNLSAYTGYAFTDSCKAYINSSEAHIIYQDEHSMLVSRTYTMKSLISEVAVSDVVPPTAGYKPTYRANVPEDAGYMRNYDTTGNVRHGVLWYDVENKKVMKSDDVFEEGKEYKIQIFLNPDASHVFAGYSEMSATLNGYEARVVDATASEAEIEYTFICQPLQIIRDVALNDYVAPFPGEAPVKNGRISVPVGAHYSVYEIDWRRKNADGNFVKLTERELFEAGNEYRLCITLMSDYEYGYQFEYTGERGIGQFDSVTINANPDNVNQPMCYVQSGGKYFNVYTYTVLAENPHGTTGDCEWEYDPLTETLTISGEGFMKDYSFIEELTGEEVPSITPWDEFSDTMRNVVIGDGVRSVGKYAFADCYELEEVTIGTHVETIGNGAFRNTNISSVDLSYSVTQIGKEAFYGCASLSEVKLMNLIGSIGDNAFMGTGVRYVFIPSADVTFGNRCFGFYEDGSKNEGFTIWGYSGSTAEAYADENDFLFVSFGGITGDCWWTFDRDTKTLTIGGSGAMADYSADDPAPWADFYDPEGEADSGVYSSWTLRFDGDVTNIGDYAFYRLPIADNVAIPYTCESIGDYAFSGCKKITDITLDNVKSIGEYAFKDCSSISSLNLAAIEDIGSHAFDSCYSLNNVMLGEKVDVIGSYAFRNCINLTNLTIPASVIMIDAFAFSQCSALSDVQFADGSKLRFIEQGAFRSCDLRTITLPDSVAAIDVEAFKGNSNLESVTLGKGLEYLCEEAFFGAPISSITIHSAVGYIGDRALGYYLQQSGDGGAHYATVDSLDIYGLTGSVAETYAAKEDNFHFHSNEANEGRTGDCSWYYDDTDYTLSIYGSGAMADYNNPDDAPWYGKNIAEVVIGDNVEYIGENAFNDIMGVYVPATVTEIADGAIGFDFDEEPIDGYKIYGYAGTAAEKYADKYEHIRFKDVTPRPYNPDSGISGGDNIYWSFDGDTRILTIEPDNEDLPASLEDFDYPANAPWGGQGKKAPWAKYSDKIKHIVIKDGVTAIGAYAFAFLSKANDIDLSATVASVGEGAFYGTAIDMLKVYNPECTIDNWAFGYGDKPGSDPVESYYPFKATIGGYQGSPAEAYADANENVDFVDLNSRWLYDDETSVTVITTESDVELVVEEQNTGNIAVVVNGEISYAYDISLQKDGETVQPEDDVTVILPYTGEESENIKVYRVEDDGSLTDMNAYFKNGDLIFTTDHFSLYLVVDEVPLTYILGDVDGDGKVDIVDVTLIQRYLNHMELAVSHEVMLKCGDIDGNGKVEITDATFIQRYNAKMETDYPIGSVIE